METLQNGAWMEIASLNTPREAFGLVQLRDKRLFAVGGLSNGVYLASIESINTASETQWSFESATLPTPRAKAAVLEDGEGNILITDGQDSTDAPPDGSTYELILKADNSPHTVQLFLQGTNEFPLFGSLQMNLYAPPPTQSISLGSGALSQQSWLSSFSLNGSFTSGAQFVVTMPCTVGLAVGSTVSVYTTDLDGNTSAQALVQGAAPLVCLGSSQVTTLAVPSGLTLSNQRLKLTIASLLGLDPVLPGGASATFQATQFSEIQQ